MNHSRCCANDNGNACSRAARSSAGIFRPPLFSLLTSSLCFPSPATVGFSNRLLNPTSTPSTLLTRDTTCVASNECPPNSKNFSSPPTPPPSTTSSPYFSLSPFSPLLSPLLPPLRHSLPVHLPVHRQRHPLHPHPLSRHHVLRQSPLYISPQLLLRCPLSSSSSSFSFSSFSSSSF